MKAPVIPVNEAKRLLALRESGLLILTFPRRLTG
jgi:hypothetical protein